MSSPLRVMTVGHSAHSEDRFLALLKAHGVTALADVRSSPYSRHAPQFNRDLLRATLPQHQIQYVFLGRELGARSSDPSCYVNGQVQYSRLAETDLFRQGISRVLLGAEAECIALMCAERDPLDCHRTLLVARTLMDEGVQIDHILADGGLEPHGDAMLRLLDKLGIQHELLRTNDELVAEALRQQERRIAYVDAELAAASSGLAP